MEHQSIFQESLLDLQFGYEQYYDSKPKLGWLLNYNIERNDLTNFRVVLYFVDDFSNNFKVILPFYPSILVECREDVYSVEEYIKKRFEGNVFKIETVEKINTKEYNHLNKPPKQFLKVYFKTETAIQQCIRYLKELILDKSTDRYKNEIYTDLQQAEISDDITNEIVQIHEFDIPFEIQVGIEFNIRCGCWYEVSYNGEEYYIRRDINKIAYPDLRIFAFDIETTKPPLKFPNPEFDQIMMISIMTEDFGELIVNRKIVSEDIQEFEYHAKDEMRCNFRISNEQTEEALLIRFLETILEHKPHIMTTYNGSFFDWPFIAKRMNKYGISMSDSIQFQECNEYYECPFIVHLDCYKWVKRDSYLPMNNQGLKDVTKIKLGYFPDEIDPEDMLRCAYEDPQRLASYSVSDSVATYFLYLKYVHSHILSLCSLIPYPPVHILCRGAGTLCESLLVAESENYKILVPMKKKTDGLEFYRGHIIENLTYVGGHVESLMAGIFRSDFDHEFKIDDRIINLIIENIHDIFENYRNSSDYNLKIDEYIQRLRKCAGNIVCKGSIYHLDVGAMYPNIILTNRMQPISVVNEDICIRCDYNDEKNQCKKKMKWISRVDYIPPGQNEIDMIRNQLENETFSMWENEKVNKINYKDLPEYKKNAILKERVQEYSRNIYKRIKKTEEKEEDIHICQREIPFYVETVRKFRDQRYVYKDLYKKAMQTYEKCPTHENKKNLVVYNSLQVAYKCILNSFYGYVMREGSRWFSLEMAATVCNVGGQIIKLAKEFFEKIGMPLELDTDGIWGILPVLFPFDISFDNKPVSALNLILNYFVCKKFTNYQYQVLNNDGEYELIPQNSIFFEIDGPYKTMIIPSSTEQNKLLKKRYVVFDDKNKIVELKGFELKRRGELNIIKKFQEDIFNHFNDGTTLKECYESLANVCKYWLDIILQEGGPLDDENIFYLFSESRNMSKNMEEYGNKKSNILSTAKRLSEFLGESILEEKLKCEFIISKFPLNAPVVERAIPVMIFKSPEKDVYLKKWLKTTSSTELRDIIDWDYYRKRFESILQRLIVIPAYLQKMENPLPIVNLPVWVKDGSKKEKLVFSKISDIEDIAIGSNLEEVFFNRNIVKKIKISENIDEEVKASIDCLVKDPISNDAVSLKKTDFTTFINFNRNSWIEFYQKRSSFDSSVVNVIFNGYESYTVKYFNKDEKTYNLRMDVYLDTCKNEYFKEMEACNLYVPDQNTTKDLVKLTIDGSEINSEKYLRFFNHLIMGQTYFSPSPEYQVFKENHFKCGVFDIVSISSFNYQKKPVFVVSVSDKTHFISENRHPMISKSNLNMLINNEVTEYNLVVFSKNDPSAQYISEVFNSFTCLRLDIQPIAFLDNFNNLMKSHTEFNTSLTNKASATVDISRFSGVPVLNINDRILDYILFNEYFRNNIVPSVRGSFLSKILKDETSKPGFYNSYCVQIECSNSLILSIIEYKALVSSSSLYTGYERKDFQVLRNFLKNLIVEGLKGKKGLKDLLYKIPHWIKKDSVFIDPDLREIIESTHQRYLIELLSKLKEFQCKIVASSKNMIFVDTEKSTAEGCEAFLKYLKKRISSVPGYELINFKTIRTFEKLVFVDHRNYFFVEKSSKCENGNIPDIIVSGFSNYKIPSDFLKQYFLDPEINNEIVYKLTKILDIGSIRMILKILSYRRDVHGLASNCYKLMKRSEFVDLPVTTDFNLNVFCKKCGFENFFGKTCIKCYSNIDKDLIEAAAIEYLQYSWEMQIFGDKYCNKCNSCADRRLCNYCKCGGKYVMKDYSSDIKKLQTFVSSKKFDNEVDKFKKYFNIQ